MDKDDAAQIISLLHEIKDLAQNQAQYLQEIRNAVAGDPLAPPATPDAKTEAKPDRPNQNLFDDVYSQNNMKL